MNTKDKLLDEALTLSEKIKEGSDELQRKIYYCEDEQGYLNWLEDVQVFLYENDCKKDQYDDFRNLKVEISPLNHKKIIAIINSTKQI
jgi:hypothetical protein